MSVPPAETIDLASPDEYVERRKKAKRDEVIRSDFKVHIPCLTWECSSRGRVSEAEAKRGLHRDDTSRVGRGGTGYVWIGNCMVDPNELLAAMARVQDLEADNRDPGEVGFEWWVDGGTGHSRFTLRAGYAGEVALCWPGYNDGERRDVYRIDDLLRGLALLGVLESDGPETLAPYAPDRPPRRREPEPEHAAPERGFWRAFVDGFRKAFGQ